MKNDPVFEQQQKHRLIPYKIYQSCLFFTAERTQTVFQFKTQVLAEQMTFSTGHNFEFCASFAIAAEHCC